MTGRAVAGIVAVALLSLLFVVACTASSDAAPKSVVIDVRPQNSLFDLALSISVSHLDPGERITLALTSKDSRGFQWSSRATFMAGRSGVVNPAIDPSLGGSYKGTWPMGLVSTMSSSRREADYFWGDGAQQFHLSLEVSKREIATKTFTRRLNPSHVSIKSETLAQEGFIGDYFDPATSVHHVAIFEFGGSEGGLSGGFIGAALAADGYPVLDVAYFGEPGLPKYLSRIPLEYFVHAIRWFDGQRSVNPSELYVLSGSYGSEAALLLGADFPDLVHGVIASSPSSVVTCGGLGCVGSAWTLKGRPLPYTPSFDSPDALGDAAAVIPVRKLRGPVFLDCGGLDTVWISCPYANAIMGQLKKAGSTFDNVFYSYPNAGHGVDEIVPYEPGFGTAQGQVVAEGVTIEGLNPDSNELAIENLWPKLLAWLRITANARSS